MGRAGWAGRLAVAALLAALGSPGCLAAPPSSTDAAAEEDRADARAGGDAASSLTITRDPDLAIPDLGPEVEDQVEVEPICLLARLSLDIYIEHPWRGDLVVTLVGPGDRAVRLKEFDGTDAGHDLIGNYPDSLDPVDRLDLFDGVDARGAWTILASDAGPTDAGVLRSWSLNLDCQ